MTAHVPWLSARDRGPEGLALPPESGAPTWIIGTEVNRPDYVGAHVTQRMPPALRSPPFMNSPGSYPLLVRGMRATFLARPRRVP